MPNGGPTPDCVHCKQFKGRLRSEGEPFCTLHEMNLATPIYAFCSQYVDPEPDENGDWLDQMLGTRDGLQVEWMYVWLGGYEIKFFHVPLAPLVEYQHWTYERFMEELVKLVDKYRPQLGGQ